MWEDVLQSAQATAYAQECLSQIQALLATGIDLSTQDQALLQEIKYATADPLQVIMDSKTCFFIMEIEAQGQFFKVNTNRHDGKGFQPEPAATAQSSSTDSLITEIGHALSCYSYYYTERTAMCCDIQGKGKVLFDPAWVTVRPRNDGVRPPFGHGNVGNLTMKAFFQKHNHNENRFCKALQHDAPLPATFLFANLAIIVDLTNQSKKSSTRSRILEFGGSVINVPSLRKKQVQ
jgi:hypothetical protein